jgi:hypothetical protein
MITPSETNTIKRLCLPFAAALAGQFIPAVQADTYPNTILADNPVAYYRLEELVGATTANDATGSYPGTYVYDLNSTYPLLGQPGITTNSISLHPYSDGGGAQYSYVASGYYPELNPQGPFSFEAWVRPTSNPGAGDYRCPIGNFGGWGTGGGNGTGWYLYQTPAPGSTFAFVMAQTGVWVSTGYSLFNWYHLVGTYDGTSARFYVNGVLIGTQAAGGFVANPVNPLGIGQRADGYGYWDGNLDEVAIYTNALSAATIQAHYEAGTNSFRAPPEPASIRQDPAAITSYAGHLAQFTVLADGTAPLSYQWRKGSTPIAGATGSVLTFTATVADDGALYRAVVTNLYGGATSAPAMLTVSTGLSIVASPTTIIRNEGSNSTAAFVVVAEGALPIGYQWYKGASSIPGATQQTLWLTGLKPEDDQSTYYAQVSNPYGSADSGPATLSVVPRSATVPITGYARIVMADGPVAYWRLDEAEDSALAVDAAGSFDGIYTAGAGTFTFGTFAGIPHETDTGVAITGGATVQIPYALELNPWGPFTAEGWFQPASLAADGNDYRTAFSSMFNVGGVGPTGWLLYQQGNNTWAWVPYGGNWASAFIVDTTQTIVANNWYHLVLTYDGDLFTMYVNGIARASAPYPGFYQNGDVPSIGSANYHYTYSGSGPSVLGWRSDNGFNPFSGNMDDVAFYNKALTAQQVQNHFQNTVKLTITQSGSDVIISWPLGTLQSAPVVTGTYTNVTGAGSPLTVPASAAQSYYRVLVSP